MMPQPRRAEHADEQRDILLPNPPTAELRTDVLTGRQVIVAPIRSQRPHAVCSDPPLQRTDDPFLEGFEHETPQERLALRRPNSAADRPGWYVRVVPNRFPALCEQPSDQSMMRDEDLRSDTVQPIVSEAMLPVSPIFGQHDVVIECPETRTRLAELSTSEIAAMLQAWQLRLQQLTEQPKIQSISVFRNEGFSAGASLAHCHSQIIAAQIIPPLIAERQQRFMRHLRDHGGDLIHDWLQSELRDGHRIVNNGQWLTTLCPFASRTAWNVRLVSRDSQRTIFQNLSETELHELASELRHSILALERPLGKFSFNLTLVLPPLRQPTSFRWMLDILPRTGRTAGWELLTDVELIASAPETAARELRSVWSQNASDEQRPLPSELCWRNQDPC